ncbi:MAG TPA: response regulator transcription factor [Rhizomicrobium sp.]|jgi:two-component system copper resistance phosphate regulon response regulator CusR|nr:response regulator transcription factor [Rhizomicrobium sp.]
MRILIVEDEKKLNDILQRSLKSEGYTVDGVCTAADGLEFVKSFHYDLVIIDLHLPDGMGTSLLKRMRDMGHTMPVLILTARGDLDSKVENFQAGADDYVIKPVAMAELAIRVQALLRRGPVLQENVLKTADLELNRLTRQVKRDGKRIELSPKEYSLLEYLFLHSGRTLSRSMIVEKIWDQSFEGLTNIVDVYIGHLRRKIDEGREPKLIRTVRGLGYMLDADPRP